MWRRESALSSASTPSVLRMFLAGERPPRYELVDPDTGNSVRAPPPDADGIVGHVGELLVVIRANDVQLLDADTFDTHETIPLQGAQHLVAAKHPYIIVTAGHALVALDVEAGQVEWSRKLALSPDVFRRGVPASVRRGQLFIGYKHTVYQLELQSGKTVATHRTSGNVHRLVVCDAGVIVSAGEHWIGPQARTLALQLQ